MEPSMLDEYSLFFCTWRHVTADKCPPKWCCSPSHFAYICPFVNPMMKFSASRHSTLLMPPLWVKGISISVITSSGSWSLAPMLQIFRPVIEQLWFRLFEKLVYEYRACYNLTLFQITSRPYPFAIHKFPFLSLVIDVTHWPFLPFLRALRVWFYRGPATTTSNVYAFSELYSLD